MLAGISLSVVVCAGAAGGGASGELPSNGVHLVLADHVSATHPIVVSDVEPFIAVEEAGGSVEYFGNSEKELETPDDLAG